MSSQSSPNRAKRALIDAARKGKEEEDLARFSTDGSGKALICAEFLRALILQKNGWRVHERGLRFKNARIPGQLDLSHCRVNFPLIMRDCEFGDEKEWKNFIARFDKPSLPWNSRKLIKIWTSKAAPLNVDRSHLHFLQLDGSTLHGGLMAEHAHIETGLFMDDCTFTGPVHLSGAYIGGSFAAIISKFEFQSRFNRKKAFSLNAQGAEITGDCLLRGAKFSATCHLVDISIGGQLSANDAKFKAKEGYAFDAQGAKIVSDCFLQKAEFSATCHMPGAKIGGQLAACGTKFETNSGESINAQGAEIKNGVYFILVDVGIGRINCEFTGELYFRNARLGGLIIKRALLTTHLNGNALDATNCIITGDCWLKDGFTAQGAVIFDRAEVKGELSLSGARLFSQHAAQNRSSALATRPPPSVIPAKAGNHAESAPAPQDAEGGRERNGRKSPSGEKPQGRMDSRLRGNDDGKEENSAITAFSFVEGRAGRLTMPRTGPPRGVVDLTRAHAGTLEDYKGGWPGGDGNTAKEHLVLDGFTYDHLRNPAAAPDRSSLAGNIVEARKEWLQRQKPQHLNEHFRPQPWTQLVQALRRDGYREAAQDMAIHLRRQLRKSQMHRRILRITDAFLDLVSEYGYTPWRTVAISVGLVVVFAGIWAIAMNGCAEEGCRDESVFVRTKVAEYTLKPSRGHEPATYPDFNPFGFSFDVFIPLFDFGYQDTWGIQTSFGKRYAIPPIPCWGRPDNGTPGAPEICRHILKIRMPWGGLLYLAYLMEIFLGAVMVTIAIAGFTGLMGRRREEE